MARIRCLQRACIEDGCNRCGRFILTEALGCFDIILIMLLGVAFVWPTTELNSRLLSTPPYQWPSSFSLHPSAASRLRNTLVVVSLQRFRGFRPKIKRVSVGSWCTSFCSSRLSLSLISYHRTGYHSSRSEKLLHYTIRGFGKDGYAVKTIHVFSITRSKIFSNGGRIWKSGSRRIQFRSECSMLK